MSAHTLPDRRFSFGGCQIKNINPGRGSNALGGGQCDWREANKVLTIQASCKPEDNMIVAFKFPANLQEKGNFIEVVYEDIKESSGRKTVAALEAVHRGRQPQGDDLFVKLLDQHRVV